MRPGPSCCYEEGRHQEEGRIENQELLLFGRVRVRGGQDNAEHKAFQGANRVASPFQVLKISLEAVRRGNYAVVGSG